MQKGILATLLLAVLLAAGAAPRAQQPDRQIGVGPATLPAIPAEKRTALVIGNSAYAQGPLKNPVNDAKAMAKALRQCGFEVILKTDCDKETMKAAVEDFGKRIRAGGEAALFYYAGHGIQVKGRNYLVPVGAKMDAENKVEFECLDSGLALAEMENADNRVNIVILDACRNNPFARSWRSPARGLAVMQAATGTLIAYSTAPGEVAADGEGDNSVYTKSLLEHIRAPVSILDVFTNVRRDVVDATKKAQTPWEATSLTGKFYFVKPGGPALPEVTPIPTPVPPISTPAPGSGSAKSETGAWEALGKLESLGQSQGLDRQVAMYESFAKEWAGTGAALEAGKTLAKLREEKNAADAADARNRGRFSALLEQARNAIAARDRTKAQSLVAEAEKLYPEDRSLPPLRADLKKLGPAQGDTDAADLGGGVKMELVWVPARGADGGFWVGKYEVTNAQYQQFVKDSGYNGSSDADSDYLKNFRGQDKQPTEGNNPVVRVGWKNAKAFCSWLSGKTGGTCGLPTVQQWTYACLAGGTGDYGFSGGDAALGEYAWYSANSEGHTHPVGEKKPNAFGLCDMHGNVWEWCEDEEQGGTRALRGGSWRYDAEVCRASYRLGFNPMYSSLYYGFRVVVSGRTRS